MEQDAKIVKQTYTDPVTGKFVKGNPGGGRTLGTRDFATDFDEVVEEIAAENGITKSQARKHLLKVAYKNAQEGNYSFYNDIHDRVYGQAQAKTDITSGGQPIPILNVQRDNSNNKDTPTI